MQNGSISYVHAPSYKNIDTHGGNYNNTVIVGTQGSINIHNSPTYTTKPITTYTKPVKPSKEENITLQNPPDYAPPLFVENTEQLCKIPFSGLKMCEWTSLMVVEWATKITNIRAATLLENIDGKVLISCTEKDFITKYEVVAGPARGLSNALKNLESIKKVLESVGNGNYLKYLNCFLYIKGVDRFYDLKEQDLIDLGVPYEIPGTVETEFGVKPNAHHLHQLIQRYKHNFKDNSCNGANIKTDGGKVTNHGIYGHQGDLILKY